VLRELAEETSLELAHEDVEELQTVYVRYPNGDFTYTMFRKVFHERPGPIRINPSEHQEARWLSLHAALELPLIPGEDECIFLAYGVKK
jgi:8-oxo-dGTP pyrophosphatase MutT (NUDIX family)